MIKSGILEFETEGDIAFITINNPPMNALPDPVIVDPEVLREYLHKPELKGAILSGKGNNFSIGADLNSIESMSDNPSEIRSQLDKGKEVLTILKESPIPVIALIKGACLGGGLEVALACHIRVVATTALLGFPEADLHLLPGLGGTISSIEESGFAYALPLLLSSEKVSGEKAVELGLANYVFPRKEVSSRAIDILKRMTDNKKPYVINKIMQAVINSQKMDKLTALKEESRMFSELMMRKTENERVI